MAHDPRGVCFLSSWLMCWRPCPGLNKRQASSASMLCWWGPGCSLEGGHLGDQAGREQRLRGESKTSAAGSDQSRGLRLWWTQRCCPDAAVWQTVTHCELLLGREPPPSRRTAPQWGRFRDPGAGRQVLSWGLHVGKPFTWVTM